MPLAADGDIGGVKADGDTSAEGDPGKKVIAAAKSMELEALERGEGTAEPVDTYRGLSSSAV